jgi:ABC-type transporter Mla subunit MlaD
MASELELAAEIERLLTAKAEALVVLENFDPHDDAGLRRAWSDYDTASANVVNMLSRNQEAIAQALRAASRVERVEAAARDYVTAHERYPDSIRVSRAFDDLRRALDPAP